MEYAPAIGRSSAEPPALARGRARERALAAARRWLAPAGLVAVSVVFWPSLDLVFTDAKIVVVAAAAAAAALACALAPAPRPLRSAGARAALAWMVAVVLSAVAGTHTDWSRAVLELGAGLLAVALAGLRVDRRAAAMGAAVAGGIVAAVAVGQSHGVDVFRLVGFDPNASGRLRVFGTLGNPDYVAAFVSGALCMTAGLAAAARPGAWLAALGCVATTMAVALCACRSFATGPSLLVAAAVLLAALGRGRRAAALAALLAAVALASWHRASDRDLGLAGAGRGYIWRVALPHALDAPLLGRGPGSTGQLFPAWQADHWRAPSQRSPSDSRFRRVERHVHNDVLERLIEEGLVGSVAFLVMILASVGGAVASRAATAARAVTAGAAAAVAALFTRGLVDFTLMRPAELMLAMVALALLWTRELPEPVARTR